MRSRKHPVVFVYNPGYAQRDQKENKSLLLNMPSTQCCVPGCLNRGGHTIPRDISQRKKWLYAIRRQETAVSKVDNMWEVGITTGDWKIVKKLLIGRGRLFDTLEYPMIA